MNNQKKIKAIEEAGVCIDPESKMICPDVSIGNGTNINGPIIIKGDSPCTIGKYCAIGDGIRIITVNHDVRYANNQVLLQRRLGFKKIVVTKGPVHVGNNVWLGDCATILSGVTIGDGAVVAAGAVVTKDVPPFGVAMGIPVKTVDFRFKKNIVHQLLEIKWWDWPEEKMLRNRLFFETDLTEGSGLDLFSLIVPQHLPDIHYLVGLPNFNPLSREA